jgi:hypothetical protein
MRVLWWTLVLVNGAAALWAVYLLRYGDLLGVIYSLVALAYALLNLVYVLLTRPGPGQG